MTPPTKIAIVGAGPAGLTLARLLHVSNTSFDITIFERDDSPTSRPEQGGTLDLHEETGLAAIKRCNLWKAFTKYARYDESEMIMKDKNATTIVHLKGGNDRPEIDRYRLREILLESVPANLIRWGKRLTDVGEDGTLQFHNAEHREGPFDLVVGADGAWSKVRKRLTSVEPMYAGASGFELDIKDPATICPHLHRMAGKGGLFGTSDRQLLNAQRLGDGSLKVRTWFTCPENEPKEFLKEHGKEGVLRALLHKYASWAPEMKELLLQADVETLRLWTLHELPVGTRWEHKQGFTLLGDAASLATPFSGEGVNKAMTDAMELAELLIKSQESDAEMTLDQAVDKYEQDMFPRSQKLQALTMRNKTAIFESDSPAALVPRMVETMTLDHPSRLVGLVATRPVFALISAYVWVRIVVGWLVRRLWRRN